ncbi:MAG: hypothetical protein ABI390_05945, partial [Daejeonella sp.]
MIIPTYYINNKQSNRELEKLLKGNIEKIVFRLFKEKNGELSLVAYSGKKNHRDFNTGNAIKMNVYPAGNKLDISNQEVFLGDLEINEKNEKTSEKEISILRALVNQKGCDFIVIEPKSIDPIDKNVVYEFYSTPDLDSAKVLEPQIQGFA